MNNTEQKILNEKINLLKVTIPSEYRNMLDNIQNTANDAINEERKRFVDYTMDILSGKEHIVSWDGLEKGKAMRVYAQKIDLEPETNHTTISFGKLPPKK